MSDNTRWTNFNSIIDNEELHPKEKLLILTIFRYYSQEKGYSFPSKETLKKLCGITQDRDYYKYIKSLEVKKYLVKETLKGKGCKFYLTNLQNDSHCQNDSDLQNDIDTNCQNDSQPTCKMTVQKEKEKKKKRKYIYSSETNEYMLSILLKNLIIARDKNSRARNCNIQKWCEHINKLIRLDKRTPGEIEKVIIWSQNNKFWCSNILSTEKLRKQFDTLYQQMKNENNSYVDENGIREFNYIEGEGYGRRTNRKSL